MATNTTSGMTSSPFERLNDVRFAGLRFTPMSVASTVAALAERAPAAAFAVFVTPNAEHAYLRRRDSEFRACGDTCWLSTNDSRVLGRVARIGGLDLQFAPGAYVVAQLFKRVIAPADRICVIGGSSDLVARLQSQYRLASVAHHNPPMGFIHDGPAVAAAIDFVLAHPSRFVFVAMGPPQSEKFCQRLIERGGATGVGLCIGSSLAVVTGSADPAPAWMERSGLVWLNRLIKEPRRLWRRYLLRGMFGLGLGLADAVMLRLGRRA